MGNQTGRALLLADWIQLDQAPSRQELVLHILFVCTGNICRSPTAERLVALYGSKAKIRDLTASSAGTRAVIGHPMQSEAASVLTELGGSADDFVARQLSSRLIGEADLILVMTASQRDAVLELAPHRFPRTFLLSEMSLMAQAGAASLDALAAMRGQLHRAGPVEVADPMGRSAQVFAAVGRQIATLLHPVVDWCGSQPHEV